MPVVTTAQKNHPSKRGSLDRTARLQASVSSCMPTACLVTNGAASENTTSTTPSEIVKILILTPKEQPVADAAEPHPAGLHGTNIGECICVAIAFVVDASCRC